MKLSTNRRASESRAGEILSPRTNPKGDCSGVGVDLAEAVPAVEAKPASGASNQGDIQFDGVAVDQTADREGVEPGMPGQHLRSSDVFEGLVSDLSADARYLGFGKGCDYVAPEGVSGDVEASVGWKQRRRVGPWEGAPALALGRFREGPLALE